MTSAFQSFDASSLGAFVQSGVDPSGRAGGVIVPVVALIATGFTSTVDTGRDIACAGQTLEHRYLITTSATPPQTIWVLEYHRVIVKVDDFFTPFADPGVFRIPATCSSMPSIKITGRTSSTTYTLPSHSWSVPERDYIGDTNDAYAGATFAGLTSVNDQPVIWELKYDGSYDVTQVVIHYPRAPGAESAFSGFVDAEVIDMDLGF